jgi:hypothetical protein
MFLLNVMLLTSRPRIEGRIKCKGCSEFDGQTACVRFKDEFYFYARSNPEVKGHRSVQCTQGSIGAQGIDLKPFRKVTFENLLPGYDVYFLHPYLVPSGKVVVALLSLVHAPGVANKPAGIYMVWSSNGLDFSEPFLLHACPDNDR